MVIVMDRLMTVMMRTIFTVNDDEFNDENDDSNDNG